MIDWTTRYEQVTPGVSGWVVKRGSEYYCDSAVDGPGTPVYDTQDQAQDIADELNKERK